MMYGYNGYGDWGQGSMMGSFGGGIMMIVFWVILIVFIVWIVREFRGKGFRSGSRALDVLKDRYAKGEIETEEFLEKKKNLE